MEDNECAIIPYKAEGFVGDRLGHHVNRTFDEDRSRFAYKDHFEAAAYDIQTNSSRQLNWERAKKEEWFYDDHNKTPILHLNAPNQPAVAKAVVESIKDYFRK